MYPYDPPDPYLPELSGLDVERDDLGTYWLIAGGERVAAFAEDGEGWSVTRYDGDDPMSTEWGTRAHILATVAALAAPRS
jgi:hypothetical protein